MATVYNLTSEIVNLTEYVHMVQPTPSTFNRLRSNNMNDIDSPEKLQNVMSKIAEHEIDHDDYPDNDSYQDALIDYWTDNFIQLQRIDKDSNLYQWLLLWYGNDKTLQSNVRSAYETPDALYYVNGIGYDVLDKDLLGGDGSGHQYQKLMHKLNKSNHVK